MKSYENVKTDVLSSDEEADEFEGAAGVKDTPKRKDLVFLETEKMQEKPKLAKEGEKKNHNGKKRRKGKSKTKRRPKTPDNSAKVEETTEEASENQGILC